MPLLTNLLSETSMIMASLACSKAPQRSDNGGGGGVSGASPRASSEAPQDGIDPLPADPASMPSPTSGADGATWRSG